MTQPDSRSDDYLGAREGALSWLKANWDPTLTVRQWWALLADSGWGFPTWPTEWFGQFADTVDGTGSLDLSAGSGDIAFEGAVGGQTPLSGLTISSETGMPQAFSRIDSAFLITSSIVPTM